MTALRIAAVIALLAIALWSAWLYVRNPNPKPKVYKSLEDAIHDGACQRTDYPDGSYQITCDMRVKE